MQDFVDQAHGVDLPCPDGLLREVHQVALVIDLLGEDTRGMEVCEHNISVGGKQSLVKLVTRACLAGYMEFP